jgi:hypothetical protein
MSMTPFGDGEVSPSMCLVRRHPEDMAKDPNIVLALLALQRAISRIRYIEENEMGIAEFRECFPSVIDELNKATSYLNTPRVSSPKPPIFFDN